MSNFIYINNEDEAIYYSKFIINLTVVIIDKDYTLFSVEDKIILFYPKNLGINIINNLLKNNNIKKIITKPYIELDINNYIHIGSYINDKRILYEMKREILNRDLSLENINIILKYKKLGENLILNPRKTLFNNKRDCYLLYLTIFNDIISKYGSVNYEELIIKTKDYPKLCREEFLPIETILDNFIRIGSFNRDENSLISISKNY